MRDLSWERPAEATLHQRPASVVAVLGSTGFVGGAVATELRTRGIEVRPIPAPRLRWPQAELGGDPSVVPDDLHRDVVDTLAQRLDGAHVVVNAAGIADGNAPASLDLYGANALLPVVVARACSLVGADRYVHLSSAAVQGVGVLDESARTAPFSPYSRSKALGERLLLGEKAVETVAFRSTWVHDVDRPNTRAVVRLASSRWSCVAGDGSAPTPQVLVGDIAAAVAHLVLARGPVPPIVLQPANGMTTRLLLRLLGGREPRRLPEKVARGAVRGIRAGANLNLRINAHARRLDMLLFGKPQVSGWLTAQGVVPELCSQAWERLAYGSR